jgi:predicted transcriptional regulator
MLKGQGTNIPIMTITVSVLMGKRVYTIEETASMQETAKKMKDKKVSSLLVLDIVGKPIGLAYDIVCRCIEILKLLDLQTG